MRLYSEISKFKAASMHSKKNKKTHTYKYTDSNIAHIYIDWKLLTYRDNATQHQKKQDLAVKMRLRKVSLNTSFEVLFWINC